MRATDLVTRLPHQSMAAAATVTAARFLNFSALRFHHRATTTVVVVRPYPTPCSLLLPQTKAMFSAFSTAGPETAPTAAASWPEWEEFIEQLRSRGYLKGDEGRGNSMDDYGQLKVACLAFARDRPHLLRSLPRNDIQAVVECGCPNLIRKSVNSAKRLRVHLNLDEETVCRSCTLRESCDRAYVLAKESGGARTVDIMRILLQYASQILPKESVEASARRLLSELIKLGDTRPGPEHFDTMTKAQTIEKPLLKKTSVKPPPISVVRKNRHHQNVEMQRGDWICTQCNFLNFSRNLRCLQCKADSPTRDDLTEMKKGDWICSRCRFMNFASNKECRRCRQELRPQRALEPGEWECPLCDFLNFWKNRRCLKCSCNRPEDASSPSENGDWRPPKLTYEVFKLSGLVNSVLEDNG